MVGVTAETDTGFNVIVAVADLELSAALVALTTTTVEAVTTGAVYLPVESIVPRVVGLSDQVTAVLVALVTAAVNCCVWP